MRHHDTDCQSLWRQLYDLAAEEKLDGQIMEQMNEIRQIFRENPGYLKLLGEPAIPEKRD